MRVGIGFDVHRFTADRPLILGGVEIPYYRGLAGHSDADVLSHALMDAVFGALAAGDIGEHFPDTDLRYKDVSSLELLAETIEVVNAFGGRVSNIDAIVISEEPKLAPWRRAIRENLSKILGLPLTKVSVKATTTEGLGFTGRKEGIAAQAVVLIEEPDETVEEMPEEEV